MARREEAVSHLGHPERTVCSDGTSSSHKTALHCPGSPLCPKEQEKEGKNNVNAVGDCVGCLC